MGTDKTIDQMSVEELGQALAIINQQRDELKRQADTVNALLNRKIAEAETAARIAAMSPAEREAMKAALASAAQPE